MPFESSAAAPQPTPFAPPTLDITVGSLISRTFGVWSHTMWKFLGFTVVLFLPVIAVAVVMGVGVAAGGGESLRGNPGAIFGGVAILVPLLLLAALVQMGGVTYGAIQELAGSSSSSQASSSAAGSASPSRSWWRRGSDPSRR